ncbi:MAG TPA: hypothetical protein VNL14_16765 [Candidatus Acidoferrales bacterium]|nr:hypothetical protein [Candidatus Acidoferrales bacterium]
MEITCRDREQIELVRRLQELTGAKGCVFPEIATGKEWWDRLVQVYVSLNLLGKQIDDRQKRGDPPSEDQISLYQISICEFYRLLELCGIAQEEDLNVEDTV